MERTAALKAPPKVVEAILAWAHEEIAANLLAKVERRYESALAMSKDKGMDKFIRKQFEDKAKTAKALLDDVKKYATKAADPDRPLAYKEFALDLTGWPYAVPKTVPKEVVALVYFKDPSVKFGAAQFTEGAAQDSDTIGGMHIYASEKGLDDIIVASDFRRALARIETSVEHESQHLAQILLQRASGSGSAGHPDKRTPRPGEYDPFKEPAKYHTDPREFWPLLDSVAREMRLKLEKVPEDQRSAELRRLIDKEPMLMSLQKRGPLWTKAVRELTKKLGPDGMPLRVALRFVPIV